MARATFNVDAKALDFASKRADQITRLGLQRKLGQIADAYFDFVFEETPVASGQLLANYKVLPDGASAGVEPPQGPSAWKRGGQIDTALEAANKAKAIAVVKKNYDKSIFRDPFRLFNFVNNAPHAADVEYKRDTAFPGIRNHGFMRAGRRAALVAVAARSARG